MTTIQNHPIEDKALMLMLSHIGNCIESYEFAKRQMDNGYIDLRPVLRAREIELRQEIEKLVDLIKNNY